MSGIVAVYAVFASGEEAERIGRAMIEERLAACVNVLGPARSIYRWQDKIETAEEVAAIFKTTEGHAPLLVERIAALHGYDVPAVTAWPIVDCPAAYRAWVIAQVS